MNTPTSSFRFSDETRHLLDELAARNDMSATGLLVLLIRNRARREGLLPPFTVTTDEPPVKEARDD